MERVLVFFDMETTGFDPARCFPIEVGMVFARENLQTLVLYKSLINPFPPEKKTWNKQERKAFAVHGIKFEEIKEKGASPAKVVKEILQIVEKIKKVHNPQKFVLVSNNAVFDHAFLRKLFQLAGENRWPFHYVVWDTNLLVELAAGMENINMAHRALGDALIVKETVERALRAYKSAREVRL